MTLLRLMRIIQAVCDTRSATIRKAPAMPGISEIAVTLVVCFIVLVLFGKRLPEVARSIGESFVAFKRGIKDTKDDEKKEKLAEGDEKKKIEE